MKIKIHFFWMILLILLSQAATASATDVYMGETVSIAGAAYSNYVYIFITGPNLPANGANPEDVYEEVITGDSSSFVRVTTFNNRWSYNWDTEGGPDAGTYVFYAVDRPAGRYDLSGAEYSVNTVTLLDPSVSVTGVSSSKNSGQYSVSSTPDETGVATAEETEGAIPATATATPAETLVSTPAETGTQAAGLPVFLLVLSLSISFLLAIMMGKRSE